MSFQITRKGSHETVALVRDVRHDHPEWVHLQLGTAFESELQSVIDNLQPRDYLDGAPDCDGVSLASEYDDRAVRDAADRSIVHNEIVHVELPAGHIGSAIETLRAIAAEREMELDYTTDWGSRVTEVWAFDPASDGDDMDFRVHLCAISREAD